MLIYDPSLLQLCNYILVVCMLLLEISEFLQFCLRCLTSCSSSTTLKSWSSSVATASFDSSNFLRFFSGTLNRKWDLPFPYNNYLIALIPDTYLDEVKDLANLGSTFTAIFSYWLYIFLFLPSLFLSTPWMTRLQ